MQEMAQRMEISYFISSEFKKNSEGWKKQIFCQDVNSHIHIQRLSVIPANVSKIKKGSLKSHYWGMECIISDLVPDKSGNPVDI